MNSKNLFGEILVEMMGDMNGWELTIAVLLIVIAWQSPALIRAIKGLPENMSEK